MKIYKLTINEVYRPVSSAAQISGLIAGSKNAYPILVEYYATKETAQAKKVEILSGIASLLGAGAHGKYEVEIQEIDVKE